MSPVTKASYTWDNVNDPMTMIAGGVALALLVIKVAGWK
jgi:hypothetical protein